MGPFLCGFINQRDIERLSPDIATEHHCVNAMNELNRAVCKDSGLELVVFAPHFCHKANVEAASANPADLMEIMIIPFGGRAHVIIDYFPTGRSRYIRRISESEFTAMYYRNLAGEAIVAGDFPRAYWLVKESMLHAPDHAEAINMLAVLYRRSGDEWAAEQIYLYGLNSARERLSLLKNYRTLLREQGRTAEAGEMTRRLARYNDADPFEWWFLAEDAYGEEKYSDALSYYKKSVEIAPYLHEGYFGMAKTYFQQGRVKSARSAMRQAIENADRPRFKTLYEAKLKALSGGQAN